ncbi:MAG: hypothetical protein ACLP50_12425 [Solirubrobacteraceae bacterium]
MVVQPGVDYRRFDAATESFDAPVPLASEPSRAGDLDGAQDAAGGTPMTTCRSSASAVRMPSSPTPQAGRSI